MNRAPFESGEWYHCYSRGVDKRTVFERASDYERFLQSLYLCNSETSVHRSNHGEKTKDEVYEIERKDPLVSIGAYCLMSNHFHLLLRENSDDGSGISRFMQKLGTSYTMYFNIRKERTGNLFVKPFRSRHVKDDRYFKRVAQYIHFNPIEIFEPKWKEGKVLAKGLLENRLRQYTYSSLPDFHAAKGERRPERAILDEEALDLLSDDSPSLSETLSDMREYYSSLS